MSERLTKVKKRIHKKKHGFLSRSSNASGKKVIQRRRTKGRKEI